jgi:hypothetical protein
MKVWCFKSDAAGWALTDEPAGLKLPEEFGPWILHKQAELAGDAADEREAIELIGRHGYCCFRSETVFQGIS